MGTFRVIPKEIKEQILNRIKNEGVSVTQAATDHGVSTKTIYNWLRKGIQKDGSYREISYLKKLNHDLLLLVGQLTLESKKFKKNKSHETNS